MRSHLLWLLDLHRKETNPDARIRRANQIRSYLHTMDAVELVRVLHVLLDR